MTLSTCSCKGKRTCLRCEVVGPKKTNSHNHLEENSTKYLYNRRNGMAELAQGEHNLMNFAFPGILIYSNFITDSEENDMIQTIDSNKWKPSQSGRYKQDYGPKVNFKKKKCKVSSFTGLPLYSQMLVQRLQSLENLQDFKPVELCNLEYSPERGSAIDPHFDDDWLWGERLITLNLLSSTWLNMTWGGTFEEAEVLKNSIRCEFDLEEIVVRVPLERKSLVVLYGPARYQWKHSILREDIQSRRLCSTFRELSEEFLTGERRDEGRKLLNIAHSFDGNVVS